MDNWERASYDGFMIIDAHAHLSFLTQDQVSQILNRPDSGLSGWILGGYDPIDWERQKYLKDLFPDRIQTCFGLHPWEVGGQSLEKATKAMKTLESVISDADWVGELGLDVSSEGLKKGKDLQIEVLKFQLELARSHSKPCVFHLVGGTEEFFKAWDNCPVPGFVHGFTGSPEVAREIVSRGLLISIGPGLLKSHFKNLQKTVDILELEHLLVESDSPHSLDDESYQGLESLPKIVDRLCEMKSVDQKTMEEQLGRNLEGLKSKGYKSV